MSLATTRHAAARTWWPVIAAGCSALGLAGWLACGAAARTVTPAPARHEPAAHGAMIRALRDDPAAFRLYMLNCGGCHRANGRGVARNGVPSFVDSAAVFMWIPQGREYLIRVPGSASSRLSDAQLAKVLNWIVTTYSRRQLPPDFQPFTTREVAAVRHEHYRDVAVARRRVAAKLHRLHLKPSPYRFGVNRWNDPGRVGMPGKQEDRQ